MTEDQKRALGIGGAGVAGFLLWQHFHRGNTSKRSVPPAPTLTNAGGFGAVQPYTPQAPTILAPGQSVYDPNSQALLNTPTAVPARQPQTTRAAGPAYVVNVNYPKTVTPKKVTHKPTKRKPTSKKKVQA